jgi:hypothetical protein
LLFLKRGKAIAHTNFSPLPSTFLLSSSPTKANSGEVRVRVKIMMLEVRGLRGGSANHRGRVDRPTEASGADRMAEDSGCGQCRDRESTEKEATTNDGGRLTEVTLEKKYPMLYVYRVELLI